MGEGLGTRLVYRVAHCVAKVHAESCYIDREVAVNPRLPGIIYQWLSRFLNHKHNMQSNAEYNMIIVQ